MSMHLEAFRAVEARLFRDRTYLSNVGVVHRLQAHWRSCELEVWSNLPEELDTIFPFDLELVYQLCEAPTEPFDPKSKGARLVLHHCRVEYVQPLVVLMLTKATGQVEVPPSTFMLHWASEEWFEGGQA